MQLTATQVTCPLCKHPVGSHGGNADPTRLCEDCRQIVQTIRSSGNSRVGVMEPLQARATPQPPVAITAPILSEPESDTQAVDEEEAPIDEPLGFKFSADADSALLDFDELFDREPEIRSAAQEAPAYFSEPFRFEGVSQVSHVSADPMPETASQPTYRSDAHTLVSSPAFAEALHHQSEEIAMSQPDSDPGIGFAVNSQPVDEFFGHEVVTNPLEEPAQWDYSPSDFPILVGGAEASKHTGRRLTLVAVLLICFGVAGYFVIYRPSIQASQNSAQIQLGETRPGSVEQQPATQARPQTAVEKAQSATPLQAESESSPSSRAATESLEGRYSLQAAAFPNEAGANDFCERLKRAGVPAYVVSAEIAGRGTWFRVRVGRFASAQDADRFASEARVRARASGLNLQLIVSSYDKP